MRPFMISVFIYFAKILLCSINVFILKVCSFEAYRIEKFTLSHIEGVFPKVNFLQMSNSALSKMKIRTNLGARRCTFLIENKRQNIQIVFSMFTMQVNDTQNMTYRQTNMKRETLSEQYRQRQGYRKRGRDMERKLATKGGRDRGIQS